MQNRIPECLREWKATRMHMHMHMDKDLEEEFANGFAGVNADPVFLLFSGFGRGVSTS